METLPSKAGVVSASCEAVTVQGNFRLEHVPLGPTPIIVDQSILTTGRPLLPDEEKRLITPQTVVHAAQQAVTTLSHDNEGASLGHPAYFLVHENVVDPFMRALVPILPSGLRAEVQPLVENRQKIESFLSFLDDRLPTFTPVYTVRSIDAAMDFIQSQSDTARQVYVLGSPAFGAYVANSMRRIDSVLVNAFADSHVGLGPYANSRSFSFTRSRKITSTSLRKPSSHNGRGGLDRIQAWKLSQDPGKRVDFFGGSGCKFRPCGLIVRFPLRWWSYSSQRNRHNRFWALYFGSMGLGFVFAIGFTTHMLTLDRPHLSAGHPMPTVRPHLT